MAEVKTGLEGRLGWMDENGTLGKVYYNSVHGSAGTKGLGVGTAANTGSSMVYIGSGFHCSSGVWKYISATSVAVGSSGSAVRFYGIEAGSDGVVDLIAGGTGANVAAAISARTATTAGQTPLAYVTVGTSGSVIAGSIVNERTFHVPTSISYVTGVDWSTDEAIRPIHDGPDFKHYKAGRKYPGKLGVKELYVNMGSADVWPSSSTYHTVPTIAFELDIDGINGTVSESILFQRCAKESQAFSQPEVEDDTYDLSVQFGNMVTL